MAAAAGGADPKLPISNLRGGATIPSTEELKKQSSEMMKKAFSASMSALQMFGLFGLHGATLAIIFGLFTMHEGNADGSGSKLAGMLS